MNNSLIHSVYQQNSVRGTTPVGQVVALYDTILRDFHRGLAAFDAGDIEARVFELNHALTVIGELQNVLDFENGAEAAKRLKSFYELARVSVLQVSVSPSREGFQRLIELFRPVRQAWQQIEQQLPAAAPREATPEVRVQMSVPAPARSRVETSLPAESDIAWRG